MDILGGRSENGWRRNNKMHDSGKRRKEDQRQLGKTILQSKQVDICCYQINTKLAGGCLSKKQPTLELRTDENRTRLGS